jgi:hypothetical protein
MNCACVRVDATEDAVVVLVVVVLAVGDCVADDPLPPHAGHAKRRRALTSIGEIAWMSGDGLPNSRG